MKKITLLVLSLFILGYFKANAQDWKLGGNTLTDDRSIGSIDNFGVIFKTNNAERGRITNNGLWGIGTITPSAKLHINSITTRDPFKVQVNGRTKLYVHKSGGVTIGHFTPAPANGLYVAGNVGIGTSTPEQKLHVVGNEILTTGVQSGFKFRDRGSDSSNDDWVWYSEGNIARFWRAGIGDLLSIATSGNMGVGTLEPESYKLKVSHQSFGFNIEENFSGNDWEFVVSSGSSKNLYLYANGSFRGTFDGTTGAYSSVSDERLKTNIQAMPSVLTKINQLKPTTYQFKSGGPQTFGFIAQDVMKVFPNMVTLNVVKERNLEEYTLDYSGFGVLAIKGIQELQQEKQELVNKINALETYITKQEDRLAKLEAALGVGGSNFGNPSNVLGASLQQNQPNPFDQTTTFRYTVPAGAQAQINVYEATSGSLIKTITAPASGQAQINAYDLKGGTYIYTLVINGKVAESKQMLVVK